MGLATSDGGSFEENSDVLTNDGTEGRGFWPDFGVWKAVSSVKTNKQIKDPELSRKPSGRQAIMEVLDFQTH